MTNSIEVVRGLVEAREKMRQLLHGKSDASTTAIAASIDAFKSLAYSTDLSQVLKELERLEKLEEFRASIIEHYPNQDMDHVDFRVNAYRHALALEEEHSHE